MPKPKDAPSTPAERAARLRALRDEKTCESAHAFVRANAALFYATLAAHPSCVVGPSIWVSGDAHVENAGAVCDAKGNVELALNDFDESVVGNPSFDVARLALSLATLLRSAGFSAVDVRTTTAAIADGYEGALEHPSKKAPPKAARLVRMLEGAARADRKDLLTRLTGDDHPSALPIGDRFWPLSAAGRAAIEALVSEDAVATLVKLGGDDAKCKVRFVDAVFRVAGTASLGGFRAAALIEVDGAAKGERLRVLDLKEVQPAVTPRDDARTPKDDAERILQGTRALAPAFGARKLGAVVQGRSVIVRELMAQERKVNLDGCKRDELADLGGSFGEMLGRAHGRQLEANVARAWRSTFAARRPDGAPPSWLWDALSSLVAAHEHAYLEHAGGAR